MNKQLTAVTWIVLFVFLLAACNLPAPAPTDVNPNDAVNTAAAKTVVALSTELAAGRNPTLGPDSSPQQTPAPGSNSTQAAGAPTSTSETQAVRPTVDPNLPCNQAEFVSDVTIPDDSTILPGTEFQKVWELRNTGSCTWTSAYTIVLASSSNPMAGPASSPLIIDGEVLPGDTVKATVTMRAPNEAGNYRGSYLLKSPDGKTFGVGPGAQGIIYALIRVADEYYFAEHICSAAWSTPSGALPCPGSENDSQGFIVQLDQPTLEDNSKGEGLALLTMPQPVPGGFIVGRFPPVIVPTDADFRATIGCQPGATGCYVRIKVTYQVDNGPEQTLGEWNEGLDGNINHAIADLDMVAGKSVSFNFYAYVNGTPEASKALWSNPRIVKE